MNILRYRRFFELRERYLKASIRKEKSRILDEYCSNTGQARKYIIRKIQPGVDLRPRRRKKRQETYDGEVKAALARVWEIFDYPCGQRLKPVLLRRTNGGRKIKEAWGAILLRRTNEVALKLRGISSATIRRIFDR